MRKNKTKKTNEKKGFRAIRSYRIIPAGNALAKMPWEAKNILERRQILLKNGLGAARQNCGKLFSIMVMSGLSQALFPIFF